MSGLAAALRAAGIADVDDSALARSLYASDASLYRIPPQAVVRPRTAEEISAALEVARSEGVPLTMRGAGTSIAGNAIGPGIVLDTSRHFNRVLEIDAEAHTARVEPGLVQAALQAAAAPHGLRFGPDPSTHNRCTIGGMIGNNACGSRALGYGRTADNVESMTVLLADGTVHTATAGASPLDALVDAELALIRTEFGRFGRQVSGYSFEHLLPERGRRFDRFLVGSEGTLAIVLDATVRLVEDPPARALAVLGYPDMASAADATPGVLDAARAAGIPVTACEGLGSRIADQVPDRPDLPDGGGWLFVEVTGESRAEVEARAAAVGAASGVGHRVVAEPAEQAAIWKIREDGAGLATKSLARRAHPGWEDAAVPPEQLGDYLRDFERLLADHRLDGVPFGHFGDGCVHVRIDFDFDDATPQGAPGFRAFLSEAADLVAGYGGSMSGEHGDGRARSELLPRMYSAEAIALMGRAKAVLDPDNLLNPGNLVDPAPVDADLRLGTRAPQRRPFLALAHDGGSLTDAVHRCNGVGKCRSTTSGGVMCPSYRATGEEKDSTRGRARVLQDVAAGHLAPSDPAVAEALDLCLSCKGCARDCPTGIDMATYKSETLHQQYAGRRRPRSHYTLGRLPMWAKLTSPVARVANVSLKVGPVAAAAKAVAGLDPRRGLPSFAPQSLRRWARGQGTPGEPDVWIWADSFTDKFLPDHGRAAIELLAAAGLTARVIDADACCGLTWITTGQLDQARRIVGRAVERLHPYVTSGVPVIGLEPSCLAALRTDAPELVSDPRAGEVAAAVQTLAEFLTSIEWTPPDLTGVSVVAQPHCHHASVLGWAADEALLRRSGAELTRVGGCCGLAGNFGVEQGHYEVSVAVAETELLPAVRANPGAVVLADGMSCQVQLDDLAGVDAVHLAELFAPRAGAPSAVGTRASGA